MREVRRVSYPSPAGPDIQSYLSLPDAADPRPVVLILRGVAGGDEGYTEIASRLSDWGYAALIHGWHGGGSNPADDIVLGDLAGAVDYLQTVRGVEADRLAVAGFCKGGIYAFMAAARHVSVRAILAFHGFAYRKQDDARLLQPYDLAPEIAVPVLLMHGSEDKSAPPADMQALDARLRSLGKDSTIHVYAGAAHGFAVSTHPNYSPDHASRSFVDAKRFLDRHLPIPNTRSSR